MSILTTARALWISILGALAIAGALAACATSESPQTAAGAQCYWLSNEGAGWLVRPDLTTARACFEMDSCSGGAGLSGGGCYKWATSAGAPPLAVERHAERPAARSRHPAASGNL